jgi:adenylate cyclase
MKYAVIGDTVNVASRLEGLNKELDSQICLSRDVYTHLPNELAEKISYRGDFQVKGREQSVKIYTL